MKNRYKILLKTAPVVLFLDQLTKGLIVWFLPVGGHTTVLSGFFDIVHSRNPGAAFGSFASLPASIRLPFFYFTSLVALGVILIYFYRLQENRASVYLNLSLILGGALGNIGDRLFRGEVVDFLSFHWYDRWAWWNLGWFHLHFKLEWPAFNVADAAITIGVLWLMGLMAKR